LTIIGAEILAITVALTAGFGTTARADVPVHPRLELSMGLAHLGSVAPQDPTNADPGGAGLSLGLHADLRFDPGLLVGGDSEGYLAMFSHGESYVGGHLGWAFPVQHLELDILGEAGVHSLAGVGGDLFATSDAPTVYLPYAGLRVGLSDRFRRHVGGGAGFWVFARRDLEQTSVVAHVTNDIFGGEPETHTIAVGGGYTVGVAFRLIFGS
jgi:hypothetical protein